MRSFSRLLGGVAFVAAALPASAFARVGTPGQAATPRGGALVLDHERLWAFVADADNAALHRVDLSSGDVATTPLPCAPEQVLRVGEARLAVSLRSCQKVALLTLSATGEARVDSTIDVPAEPWGLALAPNGMLLVTSAWGHALTGIDTGTETVRFSLDLPREPRGVTMSPDGRRAFVTHAVGDALTVIDLAPPGGGEAPAVRAVRGLGGDHRNRVDRTAGALTSHPTASLAYTAVWNETGTRLFVPHLLVQNGRDTARFVGGGYGGVSVQEDTSVAEVSVLVAATEQPLSGPRETAAGPRETAAASLAPIHTDFEGGSAVAPSGSPSRQARAAAVVGDALFVTSFGTGQLVELDARAVDPAMSVRRAFDVGEGPSGLDVDEDTGIAVVWSQLAHAVSVVSLGSGSVERIPVAEDPLSADMALGRRLFHAEGDRRLSRDGRACAGCHPEGRADGLVWRLGGGARKTLVLAGRLDHGPYGWNGEHAALEDNMEETIRRLGGTGLSRAELSALATYLKKGLTPPPAPVVPASAEALVQRGKSLFQSDEVGCYWCHKLDQEASDRSVHDVGSRAKDEERAAFRTPPLRFVSGAGPYFHDGRYPTLEAVIDQNLDRMGNTTALSKDDKAALVAFLRSL
jgi:DNA-binding beta-propeller fold protein YncE